MNKITKTLRSPLATAWSEQYVRLTVEGLSVGAPYTLLINDQSTPFQHTGRAAEVLVRLGFAKDEEKTLEFVPGNECETNLERVAVPLKKIGIEGRELLIANPLAALGPFPVDSCIRCDLPVESIEGGGGPWEVAGRTLLAIHSLTPAIIYSLFLPSNPACKLPALP